jgi:hypothetical protein
MSSRTVGHPWDGMSGDDSDKDETEVHDPDPATGSVMRRKPKPAA